MTRIALYQANTGIDPQANAAQLVEAVTAASGEGAEMLFTPEMSGLLDRDRKRAAVHIVAEEDNPTLAAVRDACAKKGIWTCLGSLAVDAGERMWANRCFVIDSTGEIAARYDKIHMFDVDLDNGESWRESNAYRAGENVVTAVTPLGRVGLSICYDLRFPSLFEALGQARCDILSIPAAFTVQTGKAHWHVLQRARAIEASAFVIAAAQVGQHEDGRQTYGHSLVVDPWGEVLLDMGGDEAGVGFAEINVSRIKEVRDQVPSLANRRKIVI